MGDKPSMPRLVFDRLERPQTRDTPSEAVSGQISGQSEASVVDELTTIWRETRLAIETIDNLAVRLAGITYRLRAEERARTLEALRDTEE